MCGIGAVWDRNVGIRAREMSVWLMHRGEEGVRYAFLRNGEIAVGDSVPEDAEAALVHARYSTTGPYGVQLQPVLARYRDLEVAVAFNGTVANYRQIAPRAKTDSEAYAQKLAEALWEHGLEEGLRELYSKIVGAASSVFITAELVVGFRDPRGVRPLSFSDDAAASETIALGGRGIDLRPGHAVVWSRGSARVVEVMSLKERLCSLEFVYFAHPGSRIQGRLVADVRRELGRRLAEGEDADIEVVAYVPETARHAAAGYAEGLGRPLVDAVLKNRYSGRIFIKPPYMRNASPSFRVVEDYVKGRRVALVDDSLIRGTNLRDIVVKLKAAGAREVHVRIASPPVKWPCFFGMDFQSRSELMANGRGLAEIARLLRADSLRYLSLEQFKVVIGERACYGCFTGRYPQRIKVAQLEREIATSREKALGAEP
ncbi:amidophosphoribosyltransferase [Thermoproteus tenax]|uniref:amidophosphoribosyltransferase n=1 Tax=Thermoproteus tenax TaxID=2271 RepID=UPI00069A7F50|nr:amidophosphoribosyltransferase [Thermoproteus tenax]